MENRKNYSLKNEAARNLAREKLSLEDEAEMSLTLQGILEALISLLPDKVVRRKLIRALRKK